MRAGKTVDDLVMGSIGIQPEHRSLIRVATEAGGAVKPTVAAFAQSTKGLRSISVDAGKTAEHLIATTIPAEPKYRALICVAAKSGGAIEETIARFDYRGIDPRPVAVSSGEPVQHLDMGNIAAHLEHRASDGTAAGVGRSIKRAIAPPYHR